VETACSRTASLIQHRGGTVTDIVSLLGKGIKASVDLALFTVTLAGQANAFFDLSDTPRPGSNVLVAELNRRGKEVIILSGDTQSAVDRLANTIGVPVDDAYYAAYTPEDKDAAIVALQAKGQRVCFVGDGTNDGPALSRADVSLAVAAGWM